MLPNAGILPNVRDYLRRIWRLRYFWLALVRLDLRSKYKGSVLGIGWTLANPLATTCVLCFVFQGIFDVSRQEYIPYVLTGIAGWNFLAGAISEGSLCFHHAESYIRSVRTPLATYPLRSALGMGIHFGLLFVIAFATAGIVRGELAAGPLLTLVPTLCLLLIYAWATATIFGDFV